MQIQQVAELLVYVIVGFLAADKAKGIIWPGRTTNGKLDAIKGELDELHRKHIADRLVEILEMVKDNHNDIETANRENSIAHTELLERLRTMSKE